MSRRLVRTGLALAVLAFLPLVAPGPARASDEAAFKAAKEAFEEIGRKHDEAGARARRDAVYDMMAFLDQKACRKLLAKTYDKEKSFRVRSALAEVLAASGDPSVVKDLIRDVTKTVGKDDGPRAEAIVLGSGLGYTAPQHAETITEAVLAQFKKSKGDVRRSLLEGVGLMGSSTAVQTLQSLELEDPAERFERNVALGRCGRDLAVPFLVKELEHGHPDVRLGAVLGLTYTDADEALLHLLKRLDDRDPRVLEVIAQQLTETKSEAAVEPLVAALRGSPLRTRQEIRAALVHQVGSDFGPTPEDWKPWLDAKKAGKVLPKGKADDAPPKFFGMSIPSDRVIVLLDLSGSMDWKGRLTTAQGGLASYLEALPADAAFAAYGVHRDVNRFDEKPAPAARKGEGVAWVKKQLTARGIDLHNALTKALAENPEADTIVYATDSAPWSRFKAIPYFDSTAETIQRFRRDNRIRRVRLYVAFTTPDGRDPNTEDEGEYTNAIDLMTRMAEESGGAFELVE